MIKSICAWFSATKKRAPAPDAPPVDPPLIPVALTEIPGALIESEGLLQPQWKLIRHELERLYPDADPDQLWHSVCLSWLNALAGSLGEKYVIFQSTHFVYVANRTRNEQRHLVRIAERTYQEIVSLFAGMIEKWGHGKHVILLLEPDEYFRYIAHFYPDGDHPANGGVFLHTGYCHIAIVENHYTGVDSVLCHELTHNLLALLNLPTWLNEAMALFAQQRISGDTSQWQSFEMAKHLRHWNQESIQEYWSGRTFYQPGEESSLSYELSAVIGRELFLKYGTQVAGFLKNVRPEDYGAAAANKFLQTSLGQIASTFLGPGNWEPAEVTHEFDSPAPSAAQLALAFELIRGGRQAEAQALWQAVLQEATEKPDKLEIYDHLASIGHTLPDFLPTARRLCEEGLAIDPAYVPLRITHGALLLKEGKHAEAKNHFLSLQSQPAEDSEKATVYYFSALAAHHLQEVENARELLAKAIQLAPGMQLRAEAEFVIRDADRSFD